MTWGNSQKHIAELVDEFLAQDKDLVGIPVWKKGNRPEGDERLSWPVLIGGESAESHVAITAYPNSPDLRFTITLNYHNRNIWRVDYEPDYRIEYNPLLIGHPYSGARIVGPHCHTWQDNRHDATPAMIPEPLCWRRPIESPARSFEALFRWFCDETNIRQPANVPNLPGRTRLV